MGCCEGCLKFVLFFINIVVLVAGAALIVFGGVFLSKKFDFFPDVENHSNDIDGVLIAMIVIGAILFVVAMIGCCGACTGKSGLLNFYFIIVLLVVILEIVIIVVGIVKKDEFVTATETAADELFAGYKTRFIDPKTADAITDAEALAVNMAQYAFSCCGLTAGPSYWKTVDNNEVPPGCCSDWDKTINDLSTGALTTCAAGTEYETGCTEALEAFVQDFGIILIVVVVIIIVIQIICLAAACVSKKKDLVA